MVRKKLAQIVLLTLFIITAFYGQNSRSNGAYKTINAEMARTMLQKKEAIILDVRTPEENLSRRIPGDILIPDYELVQRIGNEIKDKNQTIIVYCRSGNRSKNAVLRLMELGYTSVYDLGGINRWPYETIAGKR